MPSVNEAFGVAYVEAIAGSVPTVGSLGERRRDRARRRRHPARTGNIELLAATIDALVDDRVPARPWPARAATAEASFTWDACGRATVAAYEEALRG